MSPAKAYLNCPRCGLSLDHAREAEHRTDDPERAIICPRCAGQAHVEVPMYLTDRRRPPVGERGTASERHPARAA